jgi:eukaryotic-like serine/threonine-protein kinase
VFSSTVGSVIAGKYRIDRQIGAGGMGAVVEAIRLETGLRVAIKVLSAEGVTSQTAIERFEREAQIAAALRSDHVVRVLETGRLDDGTPFMAMEYLEGSDLAQLCDERGSLSVEEAVRYVRQACDGIAAAHAAGIVHRDLKPQNLFVHHDRDGREVVKVLDFGISKLHAGAEMALTKTGTILGSPSFMPPEQFINSREVDARADIWALGAILYKLLLGRAPFDADTLGELCVKILQSPLPPLVGVRADVARLVERCLEKDPRARFQSIAELAAALDQVEARSEGTSTLDLDAPPVPPARAIGAPPLRRSRRLLPVLALVAVSLVVAAFAFARSQRRPAEPRSEPEATATEPSASVVLAVSAPPSAIATAPHVVPAPSAMPVVRPARPRAPAPVRSAPVKLPDIAPDERK